MQKRRPIRFDEPSGGQHSAGKRVRYNRNFKAESSGGQHSARCDDDFTVLLLDEEIDNLGLYKVDDLVYDPRPLLDPEESKDIVREKKPDVVMKVASIDIRKITWNFTCSDSCEVIDDPPIHLYQNHVATPITLRRKIPCNNADTIKFILVKTIRCKSTGPPHLVIHARDRKLLAYAIFDLLLLHDPLTYVIGNIGFALSSILQYAREFCDEMHIDVLSRVGILASPDQNLICLYFKESEKHFTPLPDTDANMPLRSFAAPGFHFAVAMTSYCLQISWMR